MPFNVNSLLIKVKEWLFWQPLGIIWEDEVQVYLHNCNCSISGCSPVTPAPVSSSELAQHFQVQQLFYDRGQCPSKWGRPNWIFYSWTDYSSDLLCLPWAATCSDLHCPMSHNTASGKNWEILGHNDDTAPEKYEEGFSQTPDHWWCL